jgi:hypothetical protein
VQTTGTATATGAQTFTGVQVTQSLQQVCRNFFALIIVRTGVCLTQHFPLQTGTKTGSQIFTQSLQQQVCRNFSALIIVRTGVCLTQHFPQVQAVVQAVVATAGVQALTSLQATGVQSLQQCRKQALAFAVKITAIATAIKQIKTFFITNLLKKLEPSIT